eukprot:Rhum_TRINITY_DN8420_c0_g1::Rhum_TRINITY_DN8420_c0_g1_i1::g.27827::m.27827
MGRLPTRERQKKRRGSDGAGQASRRCSIGQVVAGDASVAGHELNRQRACPVEGQGADSGPHVELEGGAPSSSGGCCFRGQLLRLALPLQEQLADTAMALLGGTVQGRPPLRVGRVHLVPGAQQKGAHLSPALLRGAVQRRRPAHVRAAAGAAARVPQKHLAHGHVALHRGAVQSGAAVGRRRVRRVPPVQQKRAHVAVPAKGRVVQRRPTQAVCDVCSVAAVEQQLAHRSVTLERGRVQRGAALCGVRAAGGDAGVQVHRAQVSVAGLRCGAEACAADFPARLAQGGACKHPSACDDLQAAAVLQRPDRLVVGRRAAVGDDGEAGGVQMRKCVVHQTPQRREAAAVLAEL